MKQRRLKRSVSIGHHKTSISMEDEFFVELQRIATIIDKPLARIVEEIDRFGPHINLSSALRVFVLNYYKTQCENLMKDLHDSVGERR